MASFWRRRSTPGAMSTTLAVWYTVSAFFIVAIGTVYLYLSLVKTLEYQDAELLSDRLQTIRMLLAAVPHNPGALRSRVEREWTAFKYERLYVRVVKKGGDILAQTPGISESIQAIFQEMEPSHPRMAEVLSVRTVRGRSIRFIDEQVTDPLHLDNPISIQMILDRSEVERFLSVYRERLYLVLALALLVCAAIGRRLAARVVAPIRQVGVTAARISSSTLGERLPLAELPLELAAVASSFNGMMDRLEEAFSRLSRFSADIAHELRTPISNLIGELEVALGRTRQETFYRDTMGSALEECHRVSHIIDSLLFLARAEDPGRQIRKENVSLAHEIQIVLDFYEASASEAGISYAVQVPDSLNLEVERTLFHRAIGNLVSNAIKHAPTSSVLHIRAWQNGRRIAIEVKDTGRGIAAEHLPRLTDRFYRVDASRSQDSGGSGLGLAIVKTIAHIHGGELVIESQPGSGTSVRIEFPSSQA